VKPIAQTAKSAVESLDRRPGRRHKLYRDAEPTVGRYRPQLVRTADRVAPGLRAILMGLVTERHPWPLYLHGPVGTGKTRAVLWCCDIVVRSAYLTVGEVMDAMRASSDDAPPWQWSHRRGFDPDLAVLDELGLHSPTSDFEYDAVKRFADWREDRPVIYVSNQAPEMIRKLYDRRIWSRLTCGTVFELTGPDRRLETIAPHGKEA